MADLVYYPDPILRRRAPLVATIDDEVRQRVREMFDLLYREKGIGLAAPQIGWSVRLFVSNPTGVPEPAAEKIYINPCISAAEGEVREEEGCLSIPAVRGMVTRARWVAVRAQDLRGVFFEEEAFDLNARVIQHEIDHLDGILFLSRLSSTERLLVQKELKKLEQKYAERTARAR